MQHVALGFNDSVTVFARIKYRVLFGNSDGGEIRTTIESIMGDSFDRTRDVDTPQSRATIERFAINGINGIGNYGVLATNNQFVSVGIYNGIAVVS